MAGRGGPRPGSGRKAGVPNKFTQDLKDMILHALQKAGGVEYLKARAIDTPGPFLALLGKLIPLQVNANVNHTAEMSDAELTAYLTGRRGQRAAETKGDQALVH